MESFDVFDTVLTRAVGSPRSAFVWLGRELRERGWIELAPEAFADERVSAESRAREAAGWSEVTLAQIYDELRNVLPEHCLEAARDLECEIEASLIRVVPGAEERVRSARQRHGRAIFVSDMYLPGATITDWLQRHDLWSEGDRLYLSNEAGRMKTNGELFELLLREEGLEPGALLHHGNHPQSDVEVPQRLGVRVRPFLQGNPNRFEAIMEAESAATGGVASALAGASRLARLTPADGSRDESEALRAVSAGVLAPVLTAFVVWLLGRAREAGLTRLYFLARDGQILVDLARRLAPRLGVDCEPRYLYASRQSLHLPGVIRIGEAQLDWICACYDFLSVRSLLFRVGLEPEELAAVFSQIGLGEADWDRQLTPDEIAHIRRLLPEPPLRDRILERAADTRAFLTGYLRQEGVLDDDRWAVVDVGWNGRLQASLGELLGALDRPAPRGFYYALASRPAASSAGVLEAFLFDETEGLEHSLFPVLNVSTVMEIACAADHGTVERFACVDGRYEPVLRSERNGPAIEWGLPTLQSSVRRFADELLIGPEWLDPAVDLRPLSRQLLTAFWTRPTRSEAEAWGRFPFDQDQSGLPPEPIAQPFGLAELLAPALGLKRPQRAVFGWEEGSIAISSRPVRMAAELRTHWRRLLKAMASGAD